MNILFLGAGNFLILYYNLKLVLIDIGILGSAFSVITLITIVFFLKGQNKEPDSQTLYSLVSVSLKFLMELLLALVWFFVAKKTSITSVLLFFVIYLTLTLFSIWVILNTLKNKSL
ncbi:MAG TPA: hypothetical protein VIK07_05785 [Bacteroidales bacterium]